MISGTGFAIAKTIASLFIVFTISGVRTFGAETPRNISAPTTASASVPLSLPAFVMAAISGSGNAAALAFNEAITPHAADFGLTIVQLGAVAQIAAGLGRTMSPVAGGVIILAGIAGVNPFEVAKRTALPVLIALIVTTVAMYTLN